MFVSKKKKESKIQEKKNKKKSIEQSCRINEALLRDVLARALEDLLRAGLTSSKNSVTVIGGGTDRSLSVCTLHDCARGGRKVLFRELVLHHPTDTAVETSLEPRCVRG